MTRARHIFHVTTLLQGGAGRIIVDLAVTQRARGDRPVVAMAIEGGGECVHYPAWQDCLQAAQVPVVLLDSTFRRSLFHLMGAVTTLEAYAASAGRPDIIHAHAAVPALTGQLMAGGVPVLATMHGWNGEKAREHALTDVAIFNRLPIVAVPSRAARGHLVDAGVESSRIQLLPYGIDRAEPAPLDPVDRALVDRWRNEHRTIFSCVGSVGVRKNQVQLIEAMARLRGRPIACALIGEGPGLDECRGLVEAHGLGEAVAILGYRREAAAWIREADFTVYPSTREGLPLALLESCSLGIPPIVSPIAEHEDVIRDGVNGLVATGFDAMGLADALERASRLSSGVRDALGRAAHASWRADYRQARMVAGYDALYESLIQASTTSRDVAIPVN